MEIKTVIIEKNEKNVQMNIRINPGLKSFIEGKATELGYTTNEYVRKIFTQLMEQENE